MGLFKWMCRRFSCESRCKFNNHDFDPDILNHRVSEYQLKYKDVERITRILTKRQKKKNTSII